MSETPGFDYQKIENFEVREDDIFLLTFPKSGTTWFKEILSCVVSGGDVDTVKEIPPDARVPYLEFLLTSQTVPRFKALNDAQLVPQDLDLDQMKSPRILSSHVYYDQLPKQIKTKRPKIVYVGRNAKDTAVSNHNFEKAFPIMENSNTFGEFLEKFYEGKHDFLNINWAKHVRQVWELREQDNVIFFKYEDVRKDLNGAIKKLSDFLGVTLDESTIERIANHCDIKSMRKNPLARKENFLNTFKFSAETTPFVGKGKVGGWKNVFTVAQNEKFDQVYDKWMEGSNLEFQFE